MQHQLRLVAALLFAVFSAGAAQQTITVGAPDSGAGDPLRTAFAKVTNNFGDLYLYAGRVEAFGAVPDDGVDDYAYITNALRTYGRAVLGPGTFETSKAIVIYDNETIAGAGKFDTKIHFMSNSADYASYPTGTKYDGIIRAADNSWGCTVRDLTLDANWQGQAAGNWTNTICGIVLPGVGHRVENTRVINVGAGTLNHGTYYQETFAINITGYAYDVPATNASYILNNEVELTYTNAGGLGDYTFICGAAIGGGGMVVKGNYVHDIPHHANFKPNNLAAFGIMGENAIFADNIVDRFYGNGVYGDSHTNRNILMTGNQFRQCMRGFYFGGAKWYDVTIANNSFVNVTNFPSTWAWPSTTLDVHDYTFQPAVLFRGPKVLENIHVVNNAFHGMVYNNKGTANQNPRPLIIFYPQSSGVYAMENWTNLVVYNNLIAQQGDENIAHYGYCPWWLTDSHALTNGVLLWSNNRNKQGGIQLLQKRTYAGTHVGFLDTGLTMLKSKQLENTPYQHLRLVAEYTNSIPYWVDDSQVWRPAVVYSTNATAVGGSYSLTGSYALVDFSTQDADLNALPPGTWTLMCTVSFQGGTTPGDDYYFRLYDATGAAAVPSSEVHVEASLASGHEEVTIITSYTNSVASRVYLQGYNATATRGTVYPSGTKIIALRVQ